MIALVFLAVVGSASAWYTPLVHYANGAAVPYDANNIAATNAHLAAKGYGYGLHGYSAGVHLLGKREAEAEPEADASLVTYANGAVVPFNPALHANYAAPYAHGYSAYAPYAYANHAYGLYGRKKREAEADAYLAGYPYAAHGVYGAYAGAYAHPLNYAAAPLVAHYNGAVVPAEPYAVVKARAEHLTAKAEAYATHAY